jgi:hypothetical protein
MVTQKFPTELSHEPYIMSSFSTGPGNITIVTPKKTKGKKCGATVLKYLEMSSAKPIKRNKRREHLVDEDFSACEERLKAKRNLDEPGMSSTKSFLSYSDSQIVLNITNLVVSLGNNTNKTVENPLYLYKDNPL